MNEVEKFTRVIRVGSRKSQLALVQTNIVIEALQENFPDLRFEVVKMSTKGDKILDMALSKIGDKNLFTKELENALYLKEVDFVVHSLKDVPTVMPPGLVLGCVTNRVSPFDVVLMSNANRGKKLAELPKNSNVGTSALRRIAILRRKHPHLDFSSIRGNLSTRLQKLDACSDTKNTNGGPAHQPSAYDAIILAEAGILRLGWQDRIDETLSDCLYAVGQGALACECREDDLEMQRLLVSIHDEPAALACIAERAFMSRLEGGCSTPMGVRTNLLPGGVAGADAFAGRPQRLSLQAAVLSLDGAQCIEGRLTTGLPTSVPSIKAPLGKRTADGARGPQSPPLKRARACSGSWDSKPGEGEKPEDLWLKDEYNEEELKTAGDEKAIILGLNIRPACTIARLRMARARRLGQELADRIRQAGADKILEQIVHHPVYSQSSSIPSVDPDTQVPLRCVMKSKGKRKAFYRRCAAGEQRAKQRRLEAAGEVVDSPLAPRRYIEPGMTGILVTYNNKEDNLARSDAYRLLNEAHERLTCTSDQAPPKDLNDAEVHVPPASTDGLGDEKDADKDVDDGDDDDVLASLRKELESDQKQLRDPSKFLFHAVKTGVANCLFIMNQSKKCSSAQLVHDVFRHVLASGQSNSRRILRFQPVAATCRPEVSDLKNLVRHVWSNWLQLSTETPASGCYISPDVPPQRMTFVTRPPKVSDCDDLAEKQPVKPFTFTVNFKSRSSDRLSKPDAVSAVISAISEVSPDWSPVCAAADVVVSVDVIRNVACLSLLEKFTEFWKYNLRELSPVT